MTSSIKLFEPCVSSFVRSFNNKSDDCLRRGDSFGQVSDLSCRVASRQGEVGKGGRGKGKL
jgi:hypothetical protein